MSSGLSTPNCTLIGNDCLWSCQQGLYVKMSPKIGTLGFLVYLAEIESDSQLFSVPVCGTAYYARVSASNFQVLTRTIGGARTASATKINFYSSRLAQLVPGTDMCQEIQLYSSMAEIAFDTVNTSTVYPSAVCIIIFVTTPQQNIFLER